MVGYADEYSILYKGTKHLWIWLFWVVCVRACVHACVCLSLCVYMCVCEPSAKRKLRDNCITWGSLETLMFSYTSEL